MAETKTAVEPLILVGDCLEYLRDIDDDSIDAIVTDPPYGLSNTDPAHVVEAITQWASGNREFVPHKRGGFMGKEWDSFVPPPAVWDECLRILKPGGHLLTFAGTRTMDLMTLGLRLAGFDIRDSIAWLYGSGFPKSQNVSKAIDKAQGVEGGRGPMKRGGERLLNQTTDGAREGNGTWGDESGRDAYTYAPGGDDGKKWEGWGTALKPAFEPIIMARKPFKGTVAANVLAHGTGALNIDATRIGYESGGTSASNPSLRTHINGGNGGVIFPEEGERRIVTPNLSGRWPANVVLGHTEDCEQVGTRTDRVGGGAKATSGFVEGYEKGDGWSGGEVSSDVWNCAPGCQVAELDAQSGTSSSKAAAKSRPMQRQDNEVYGKGLGSIGPENTYSDTGGASRFFYCSKAPKRERPVIVGEDGKKTVHPTVKPLELMRWLVRLVTPPGGIVLDPFAGSGTTVEAGMLEGFEVWAIESEEDYLPLIQVRIDRVMTEAQE